MITIIHTFQLKWIFNKIQENKQEKSSTFILFGFARHNCDSFATRISLNIYHTHIKDNISPTITPHPPGPHNLQLLEKSLYLH